MPLYNNVHVQYIKMGLSISYTTYKIMLIILRYLEYDKVIVNLLSMALIIIKVFFFRIQFNKIIFFLQKLHVVNDIATYIDINILHCFAYSKEFFFLNCY